MLDTVERKVQEVVRRVRRKNADGVQVLELLAEARLAGLEVRLWIAKTQLVLFC